ncbi:F0F1 ATP synthase subunit A [Oceanicella actignis]|uniref:ATP synthase subunit a n=1 Tax=Oceanicella actignis TaxID=1189325 RepID=A0A1M7S9M2_9RHOB|nr:F0F1 ATP synthase subunit A [Oceanicella actignis]SET31055.1 F-type H+-transporting ATPase subunit a [Oceanicella actignis]SHN55074.1 F-type H+-transporting ATPase subunit a [Oceanicella actignis]
MTTNPLTPEILFHLGPVPVSAAVATTWLLMSAMTLTAGAIMRRPRIAPGRAQAALEIVVEAIARQAEEILGRDPWPFMPLLGTLFLFIASANLSAAVPGLAPPTGHLETPAALALIVFFSVHWHGVRARGWRAYLRRYAEPTALMLPLNLLGEITRTFSLMIRLFGNMMSHEFVVAILLSLAGSLLPTPFMALGVLIGLVQAYIFTVLAAVYIGAGLGVVET